MLSKPVAARAQLMERPGPGHRRPARGHFPPAGETGRKREGLIASFRYGLFAPGRSRMVIDLAQPAIVSAIDVELGPDERRRPPRRRTDPDRPGRLPQGGSRGPTPTAAARVAAARRGDARRAAGHRARPGPWRRRPRRRRRGRQFEKEIVFAFAQKLKKQARGRRPLPGHDDARPGRLRPPRRAGPDRPARRKPTSSSRSMPTRSRAAGEVRGLTIYTGSERASDADSARLADRENKADAGGRRRIGRRRRRGVSDILQGPDACARRGPSRTVSRPASSASSTRVARLNKNPHRQAGFRVLRAPRRALGPDRARLPVEPQGFRSPHLRRVARQGRPRRW